MHRHTCTHTETHMHRHMCTHAHTGTHAHAQRHMCTDIVYTHNNSKLKRITKSPLSSRTKFMLFAESLRDGCPGLYFQPQLSHQLWGKSCDHSDPAQIIPQVHFTPTSLNILEMSYFTSVCVCSEGHTQLHATAHVGRSEGNLWEFVLAFPHVGLGHWTQGMGLISKCLYLQRRPHWPGLSGVGY